MRTFSQWLEFACLNDGRPMKYPDPQPTVPQGMPAEEVRQQVMARFRPARNPSQANTADEILNVLRHTFSTYDNYLARTKQAMTGFSDVCDRTKCVQSFFDTVKRMLRGMIDQYYQGTSLYKLLLTANEKWYQSHLVNIPKYCDEPETLAR
jgi:hypothetical protein